jgi:hypothetical protein
VKITDVKVQHKRGPDAVTAIKTKIICVRYTIKSSLHVVVWVGMGRDAEIERAKSLCFVQNIKTLEQSGNQ